MSFAWWSSAAAGPERTVNPLIHVKRDIVHTAEATQRLLQHLAWVWAQAILLLMMMASSWQRTSGVPASALTRGRWCLACLIFSRLNTPKEPVVPCPEPVQEAGCLDRNKAEDNALPQYGAPWKTGRSSKYRGLSWHKSVRKWSVQLRIQGKARLGFLDT